MQDQLPDPSDGILQSLIDKLFDNAQGVWKEFEETGKIIENIELFIIPIQRKISITVTEHRRGGRQKKHVESQDLEMKAVDVYDHIGRHTPDGMMRRINPFETVPEEVVESMLQRAAGLPPAGVIQHSMPSEDEP